MLTTIGQFRARIESDCSGLVRDLQELTGRYGAEEARAWANSLGKLSDVFQEPVFQPFHLYFGSRGNLSLEYQLPASSSWCDVVLLGAHGTKPSAVIVELKDWITRSDRPGRYEGLIERRGGQELHPSDQVRGYTEYCRRFHSAVADHEAGVHGCALLTGDEWAEAYFESPNADLVKRYPLFTVAPDDIQRRFPEFFEDKLSQPHEEFAKAFERGRYRQNRGFVAQIGAQILDPKSAVFELLDNQRTAFALCRDIVETTFRASNRRMPGKRVVIVKGPPGSGKSVIAARLWASLVTDTKLPDGNVVFTTTSMSQNSNWAHLFDRASEVDGASGVVRKATSYSPITTQRLGQLRSRHGESVLGDASDWRDNLATLRALGEEYRDGAGDNDNLVSIVDEAHGLINPEHTEGRGQYGFAAVVGPQAYHIIRSSFLSIFLLDPLQGFRQRENTTIEDLQRWSKELGAGPPEEISLEGAQFRCGGATEYVTWIEGVLEGQSAEVNRNVARTWNLSPDDNQLRLREGSIGDAVGRESRYQPALPSRPRMEFRVFDEPKSWEAQVRSRHLEGASVRILSSYSRKWKTEKTADPHALPASLMDFHEPYETNGQKQFWSRIWNFVPRKGRDYTWYVTGHPAGRIAADPLCEVGCPYAVRGFDYDYVGILWLNDLVWRDGQWRVDAFAVEERGMKALASAARREQGRGREGDHATKLLERVAQAYRILFTRALKGVYVWVPDQETRAYLERCLG